ncbi:MAG: hypothetical protein AB7O66_22290 [Limisphaerales bacterium]
MKRLPTILMRRMAAWAATATFATVATAPMATWAAADGQDTKPGPLLRDLGGWAHTVSTHDRRAQRYFDQGMVLLFGFNHTEAIRSFKSAAAIDPACAMAFWGVAYAHGPHVNRPMTAEDNREAWSALENAVALRNRCSDRERAYIDALRARYQRELPSDRSALDLAFASAMRDLARQFPDDLDAQTLFAESLMNTMPWDYWSEERKPKPETEEVFATLRRVLARVPDHPGANHLYIHAVEAGPSPELGIPSADRLVLSVPGAGHLVHMSSHVYMRVGQYADAVRANERAVRVDRDYIRQCRAQGFYVGVYYPHNLHFLWWAQLVDGRSADALKTAERCARYANDSVCGPSKVLEAPRLRHLPWITALRFGKWEAVLAVPKPDDTNDFAVDRAFWHFTRGLAYSATGRGAEAAGELEALRELRSKPEVKGLDSPAFPVTSVLDVAEAWLAGRVAGALGDSAGMIRELERAKAIEDGMPYMEPSYWPLPVRPALGAALLSVGDAERAEAVFREDLERWPRNGWGLLGLEESLRAQGRHGLADLVKEQRRTAWERADVPLQLAWF